METAELPATPPAAEKPRRRMSGASRFLFFLTAWLIVLMPFLFWRSTWFGRPLSDTEVSQYLGQNDKPRHIQHALVQVGERMARGDAGAAQWYPELVRLASHPVEEIRTTDAWVMGQDTNRPEFHDALRKMLGDASPMVRGNAALSLVRFGDDSGHAQIVELLKPTAVTAPRAGRVTALARAGEPANHGTMIAKIESGTETAEVRAPFTGRVRSLAAREGADVAAGAELLTLDPGTEQAWEALRALYLIGGSEDLPLVESYRRPSRDLPQRIQQQASETARAIGERAARAPAPQAGASPGVVQQTGDDVRYLLVFKGGTPEQNYYEFARTITGIVDPGLDYRGTLDIGTADPAAIRYGVFAVWRTRVSSSSDSHTSPASPKGGVYVLIYPRDPQLKYCARRYSVATAPSGERTITYTDYESGKRQSFQMSKGRPRPFIIYEVEVVSENILREVWEKHHEPRQK